MATQQALVNKLFNSQWVCELTKLSYSILLDYDKESKVEQLNIRPRNEYNFNNGVKIVEEYKNCDGLLDMLYGVSRSNTGETYHSYFNINPIEQTYLSTAKLAELVFKKGSVTLVNPIDSVAIYDDISSYLHFIEEGMLSYHYFKTPPEDDLNAFKTLLSLIENMAYEFKDRNLGESPFIKLKRLGTATATGIVTKEKLLLDGNNNQSILLNNYTKSPYEFNR